MAPKKKTPPTKKTEPSLSNLPVDVLPIVMGEVINYNVTGKEWKVRLKAVEYFHDRTAVAKSTSYLLNNVKSTADYEDLWKAVEWPLTGPRWEALQGTVNSEIVTLIITSAESRVDLVRQLNRLQPLMAKGPFKDLYGKVMLDPKAMQLMLA